MQMVRTGSRSDLSDALAKARQEMTNFQTKNASAPVEEPENICLGDLGHHCEDLLRRYMSDAWEVEPELDFEITHNSDERLLAYLQDGLELPFWRIILDDFCRVRANKVTVESELFSWALRGLKPEVRALYRQVKQVLELTPDHEDITDIFCGIDKRIELLNGFTDDNAWNSGGNRDVDDDDDDGWLCTTVSGSRASRRDGSSKQLGLMISRFLCSKLTHTRSHRLYSLHSPWSP